jgi:hypothetical protein
MTTMTTTTTTTRQIASLLRRSRRKGRETLRLKVQWAPKTLHTRASRVDFARWLEPLLWWVESEAMTTFRGPVEIVQVRTSPQAAISCDPATGVVLVSLSAEAGRDAAGLARSVGLLVRKPGEALSVCVLTESEVS